MTDETAARLWGYLARVPDIYPSVAWRVRSDVYAITIEARRVRWCVGFGFMYIQLADHFCPEEWLAYEIANMVHELDRSERT
jgi:hypothetical protein